jgi:hypothetical protein
MTPNSTKPAWVKGFAAAAAASVAIAAFGASQARAGVIMTYTGNPFTNVGGVYNTSDRITGTVDLAAPLGANLSTANVNPVSFSFNDGVKTETDQNVNSYQFLFSTDAGGNLTGWYIVVDNAIGPGSPVIQVANDLGIVVDEGYYALIGPSVDYGTNQWSPGTWAIRNTGGGVPEPASWALMIAGFGALGAALRRRRTNASGALA